MGDNCSVSRGQTSEAKEGVGRAAVAVAQPNFVGRYELLSLLAEGGFAQVWLARLHGAEGFSRKVVLKRLYASLEALDQELGKFISEAKIVSLLHHPNIVEAIELIAVGGHYYLAMEYVPGLDASRLLALLRQQKRTLPLSAAVFIVSEALRGLAHAHDAVDHQNEPLHIVHRDLSPHNILLGGHAVVKISDFGVAKVRGGKTVSGELRGKVSFMAPEQAQGLRDLDARVDVYAMGLVLAELSTMTRVYSAESDLEQLRLSASGEGARLALSNPALPDVLRPVVERALATPREARFQTAKEFSEALAEVGRIVSLSEGRDIISQLVAELTPKANAGIAPTPRMSVPEHSNRQDSTVPIGLPQTSAEGLKETEAMETPAPPPRRSVTLQQKQVSALSAFLLVVALGGWWAFGQTKKDSGSTVGTVETEGPNQPTANGAVPNASAVPSGGPSGDGPALAGQPAPQSAPFAPTSAEAKPSPETDPPSKVAIEYGTLHLNASLWANVWVDGDKLPNTTPIKGLKLTAGKHLVRLENPVAQVKQEFSVDIAPNKVTTKVVRFQRK